MRIDTLIKPTGNYEPWAAHDWEVVTREGWWGRVLRIPIACLALMPLLTACADKLELYG